MDDVFCDGKTVSIVFASSKFVWGNNPMRHSGGYLVSEHEDTWIANWSILDSDTVHAPDVRHVAQYEEERTDSGSTIVKQTGDRSSDFVAIGKPDLLLIREYQLTLLDDHGVERLPITRVRLGDGFVYTRTRSHVFVWNSTPAIHSMPELKMVRKLKGTESLIEFKKLYNWRENRTVILTEDLSYLIAVPHNGASESNVGHQHTKAFCYRIDRDEVSTVSLIGLGDAAIVNVEPVDGELQWLVYRNERQPVILDSESRTIFNLSLPSPPRFHQHRRCWVPADGIFWILEYPERLRDLERVPEGISLIRYQIDDGSQVRIQLPTARIPTP
ncbi:MAG: hypothetical protein HQ518_04420 [Rhodopirellula sp.]|nr:hypothetical protein [Rhodopirellula sp.]